MNGKITCQVCGKQFKQIQHRHLAQHQMTFEEYVAQYPDASTCSANTCEKRKVALLGREVTWANKIRTAVKKSWSENGFQGRTGIPLSEESKQKVSKKLQGHFVSDETKQKIGIAGLGRTPWNKGLTKNDDLRLKIMSEKTRAWNTEFFTQERRAQVSQTLKKKYADGMAIPHTKAKMREDLGQYFRSSWEANYARILNYEKQQWTYEKDQFPLFDEYREIISVYIPDFFVSDKFIEIKGHAKSFDNWECNCRRCERDKMKMTLFAEQYPEKQLELIGKAEWREMCKKYASKILNWEKSSYDP